MRRPRAGPALITFTLAFAAACQESARNTGCPTNASACQGSGVATRDANGGAGGDRSCGDTSGAPLPQLLGAPLIFAPTGEGFGLNVALREGDPRTLRAVIVDETHPQGRDLGAPISRAPDLAEWSVDMLAPGQRYRYEIRTTTSSGAECSLFAGSAVTARPPGVAFTFAVMTDPHIIPRDPVPPGLTVGGDSFGFDESTLLATADEIMAADPDLVVNMGDTMDLHQFGFNPPPPNGNWTRLAYLNYRRMFANTLGHLAHFQALGNWDGESGCNTAEEISRSLNERLRYLPTPGPTSYPTGGGENHDYYAFTWGDALFIVLNVMTYTPTCHLLSSADPGTPDDWTLGPAQLEWLERTLAGATSKWRFTFIHHTVGGAAGDYLNSAYGRGGGLAAHVGEQAIVHELLRTYGVQIFFYGHDHVFEDMVVDGIHYTLPGSAGAPWKFTGAETGYTQSWPDSGYGRVSVSPTRVQVDFVALGGRIVNTFTIP